MIRRLLILSAFLLGSAVTADETLLRSAAIPNRLLRQGEAQLLRSEDGQNRMRIALHTRYLDRVEAKIIAGESKNWPESPDSARYLQALRQACAEARQQAKGPIPFSIEWTETQVRITHTNTEVILSDLSPEYLRRNLTLIVMDQFGLDKSEAETLLKKSP